MNFFIRPVQPGDGKGINELRRMPGVFENILGIPSERIDYNEKHIANLDRNIHEFVAISQNQQGEETVIGMAS
jgi:putative acetyltransferase